MCRALGTAALCKSGVQWPQSRVPLFTLYIPLCNLTSPGRCFSHLSKEIHESYTPYLQVIFSQLQKKTKQVITVKPLLLCCSTIPCAPPTKSPSRTTPMLQLYWQNTVRIRRMWCCWTSVYSTSGTVVSLQYVSNCDVALVLEFKMFITTMAVCFLFIQLVFSCNLSPPRRCSIFNNGGKPRYQGTVCSLHASMYCVHTHTRD